MDRRTFFKFGAWLAGLGAVTAGGGFAFLHSGRFGSLPEGEWLERILASPNQTGGEFHNLVPRPLISDKSNMLANWARFLFAPAEGLVPPAAVPSRRMNLKACAPEDDMLVWLGHSSFYLQLAGRRLLVDPIFSRYAAPLPVRARAFAGATPYRPDDFPAIDALLISHDHWDHLDQPTLMALKSRIGRIICPLGVGAHLRRWGFGSERVVEADWGGMVDLGNGLRIHLTTSSHFSGRGLVRNRSLWCGFVLETPGKRLFHSGDGGYGPHFGDIGRQFGPFDLVMLDCGQYNQRWRHVHMMPEETAQAADDLGAKALLPAHVGKFSLAFHRWDDPFKRISVAAQGKAWQLLTPVIGEMVPLRAPLATYPRWWEMLLPADDSGEKA